MLVRIVKSYIGSSIAEDTIFAMYAEDGWVYIPKLKVRRQIHETEKSKVLSVTEEPWEGVFPKSLNMEKIDYKLYSQKPRVWKENDDYFIELT